MVDPVLEQEVDLLHQRLCYALADPKRILILYLLSEGAKYVNELVEALDMPQPTVSRHLRILRERGLVDADRQGTAVYYRISDRRIIEALDLLRAILASQLAASAELAQSLHE
jgi:DNA-binding transcriptional ArsR family regulator